VDRRSSPKSVVTVDFLIHFGLINQKEEVTKINAQIDNRSIFFVVEAKQVKEGRKKETSLQQDSKDFFSITHLPKIGSISSLSVHTKQHHNGIYIQDEKIQYPNLFCDLNVLLTD